MRIRPYLLLVVPTAFFWLGISMNSIAIAANHSQMPVEWMGGCGTYPEDHDIVHSCMTPQSRLKILSDWIQLGRTMTSPGDLLIELHDDLFAPCLWAWVALMLNRLGFFK
jgi:hypothetical protein